MTGPDLAYLDLDTAASDYAGDGCIRVRGFSDAADEAGRTTV